MDICFFVHALVLGLGNANYVMGHPPGGLIEYWSLPSEITIADSADDIHNIVTMADVAMPAFVLRVIAVLDASACVRICTYHIADQLSCVTLVRDRDCDRVVHHGQEVVV
jgi:hypothetical protein